MRSKGGVNSKARPGSGRTRCVGHRGHRDLGAFGIGGAGQHGPGLRDAVDATFVGGGRAKDRCHRQTCRADTMRHPSPAFRSPRAPTLHGAASAPRARDRGCRQGEPSCRSWRSTASQARRWCPRPPSPTRFIPSFQSPVPISGMPFSPVKFNRLIQAAGAVFKEAGRGFRNGRLERNRHARRVARLAPAGRAALRPEWSASPDTATYWATP